MFLHKYTPPVFGVTPEFQYFDAPIVLDNTAKQVIDTAA
jgi:hypothetical protein